MISFRSWLPSSSGRCCSSSFSASIRPDYSGKACPLTIQINPTILSTMEHPYIRRFLSQGHLVDSGLLTRILNLIVEEGADYEVLEFRLGKTDRDESQLE